MCKYYRCLWNSIHFTTKECIYNICKCKSFVFDGLNTKIDRNAAVSPEVSFISLYKTWPSGLKLKFFKHFYLKGNEGATNVTASATKPLKWVIWSKPVNLKVWVPLRWSSQQLSSPMEINWWWEKSRNIDDARRGLKWCSHMSSSEPPARPLHDRFDWERVCSLY